MRWFIIVARHEYDEEDTLFITEQADVNAARTHVDEQLRCGECEEGCTIYVNYVVDCGTERPAILYTEANVQYDHT